MVFVTVGKVLVGAVRSDQSGAASSHHFDPEVPVDSDMWNSAGNSIGKVRVFFFLRENLWAESNLPLIYLFCPL